MNCVHTSLLSREEMLKILEERHLNISNVKSLSDEVLLDVFNRFAVPLSQRRAKKAPPTTNGLKRAACDASIATSEDKPAKMTKCQPEVLLNTNGLKRTCSSSERRVGECDSKRKKITWP